MADPAPLDLLLVGCGRIAQTYAQALQRVPALRLAAVVEPEPATRAAFATAHGVPGFASLAAALAEGTRCAVALVLAPPVHHEPLTAQCLDRGLHVLCEKPLAPTTDAARRMLAAARRADRRLMLGSKFRYTPDVARARALLDQGVCGDVVLYENVFCAPVPMAGRWNGDPAQSGGGVLIDNGCHSVDVARYLLGPIARVQAQFGRRVQPLPVEDTARILFQSQGGALGSIDLSWTIHKETPAYVRIHGTRGTLEIGWQQSRWKPLQGEWQAFGNGYDKTAAFAAQLQNFAAAIRGQAAPVIGDADALASVQVIDCAYRSAAAERWLPVPPDDGAA